jgi:hypothetical protein
VQSLFSFPNPVNEVSARLVAGGVVIMCVAFLITGERLLLIPLAYGFLARALTGPTLSPLGQLVTRVITPRLPLAERPVPGPPKRFAQAIVLVLSGTAFAIAFVWGSTTGAMIPVAMILVAASMESFLGLCLGCYIFGLLMKVGVIPASACEACNDITLRRKAA